MSNRLFACVVWGLAALVLTGCQATRVGVQGKGFRQALLDMYTDQLLDNLIRAKNYQPFVQLAYTDLLVQQIDEISINGSYGETAEHEAAAKFASAFEQTMKRTVTPSFMIMPGGKAQAQMSFNADPITESNAIYDRYVAFAHDDTKFARNPRKPAKGDFHPNTLRFYQGDWYYVPSASGEAFFELSMQTTFKREKKAPPFFSATILDASVAPDVGDLMEATITLSGPVPDDEGYLVASIGGQTFKARILPARQDGAPMTKITVQWNQKASQAAAHELKGAAVQIYLFDYQAPLQMEADGLKKLQEEFESLNNNLNRIRALESMP